MGGDRELTCPSCSQREQKFVGVYRAEERRDNVPLWIRAEFEQHQCGGYYPRTDSQVNRAGCHHRFDFPFSALTFAHRARCAAAIRARAAALSVAGLLVVVRPVLALPRSALIAAFNLFTSFCSLSRSDFKVCKTFIYFSALGFTNEWSVTVECRLV
jgi:hypothetical protein